MSKERPTATVTAEQLPETHSVETLTAEEESVLRMRLGRPLTPTSVLTGKAAAGTETSESLLEMEADLMRRMRSRREPITTTRPVESPMKAKIVRALRKKT